MVPARPQIQAAVLRNRRGDPPIDLASRDTFKKEIREKFQDVFSVDTNKKICEAFEHSNIEGFCDQIPTVGAMCSGKAETFFEALGASDYVLNIIRKGHYPCLEGEVPSYEVPNNASYYRYQSFADEEVRRLIDSREAEVLDTDDWGISEAFLGILQGRYGEFTVDLFANDRNRKATRFYSFYHNPGCSGVNAFSHNWGDEFALMVPPVSLVGKALCHLRLCRGKGVLVVPCWPSAYFWPLLVNKFWGYIRDVMKVKGNKVLVKGENKNSLWGSNYFGGFILAILLDCSNA